MIVYLANKQTFRADILSNRIEETVHESFQGALGKSVGASELASWKNSLRHMDTVLEDAGIPDNAGVAIEFDIPQTGKRVDFIITGTRADLHGKGAQASCLFLEDEQATDAKATGRMPMLLSNLFVGSGAFTATPSKTFQGLIVDEAHRLNEKSGLFSNLGENPIKELIDASTFTVFFLDEDQRIHWKDIGNKSQIREWAESLGATVTEMDLESQFRCNGSDKYPFPILSPEEAADCPNAVPIFDIKIAAGDFSKEQWLLDCQYAELPDHFTAKPGFFLAQVIGESMNRRIPHGSWCLFREVSDGSRNGKVVIVQSRDIQDPDTGGQYTVKIYRSEKTIAEDSWSHRSIRLEPDSMDFNFKPIILEPDTVNELRVVGEYVAIIG